MVKRMPLPPAADVQAEGVPEVKGEPPKFMPGFAGVVTKIPQGVRKPITMTEEPPPAEQAMAEAGAGEVLPVPQSDGGEVENEIPVDMIDISPFQPRQQLDEDALNRLADSMIDGQINAIVVRQLPSGRYELIAGERRWRATMILGRPTVRAIVKHIPDNEAHIMAVVDNDAREDLTDYERACGYKRLLDEGILKSQSDVARRMGKERTYVVSCFAFFRLPPEALKFMDARRNLMGAANARTFATLAEGNNGGDVDLVVDAFRKVFDGKMDVANALNWLKAAIRHRHNPVPEKKVVHWESKGKRLGEVAVSGNKLVITCAEGVSPDDLMERLLKEQAGT